MSTTDIDTLSIATLRTFCPDVVENAKSGHPGAPMGLAPSAHVLWNKHMRLNPANPRWINRDRFVLSNGHACALLYTLLHLAGYPFWTLDALKKFRQLESPAAGHPEAYFPGIEVSTGPLGQGIANAVGIAIGEAHMAARYNRPNYKLFDSYTYVFCGDGCLMEGVSAEAGSLAGHLGLGKLIVLYDDNKITIDGSTDLAFTEDVCKRYESYGWHTLHVADGNNDLAALNDAIEQAKKVHDKPTLIKVTTTIAFGSSKAGTHGAHGNPLGEDDIKQVKKKFGFDPEKHFVIPDEVKKYYDHTEKGKKLESEWNALLEKYSTEHADLGKELKRRLKGDLPEGWDKNLPTFKPGANDKATRKHGGEVLNALATTLPELIGGSADLNPSCDTYIKAEKDFQIGSYQNRNIRFGVREHAMAATMNGLASYGVFIPYCSTFLNFIGYAFGAVILSALSQFRVLYIFTHDSVFLGEDGPTHQAIEKFALCRSTPNLHFFRPADGKEVIAAYKSAILNTESPTVIALTRQNVTELEGTCSEKALKGGYIVEDSQGEPEIILVGTGSELQLCVSAKKELGAKVRVVSLASWELFDEQSPEYQRSVFAPNVPVLSVEAGTTFGWQKYADVSIGIDRFGTSAPAKDVAKFFGLTVENVVAKAKATIEAYKNKDARKFRFERLIPSDEHNLNTKHKNYNK